MTSKDNSFFFSSITKEIKLSRQSDSLFARREELFPSLISRTFTALFMSLGVYGACMHRSQIEQTVLLIPGVRRSFGLDINLKRSCFIIWQDAGRLIFQMSRAAVRAIVLNLKLSSTALHFWPLLFRWLKWHIHDSGVCHRLRRAQRREWWEINAECLLPLFRNPRSWKCCHRLSLDYISLGLQSEKQNCMIAVPPTVSSPARRTQAVLWSKVVLCWRFLEQILDLSKVCLTTQRHCWFK